MGQVTKNLYPPGKCKNLSVQGTACEYCTYVPTVLSGLPQRLSFNKISTPTYCLLYRTVPYLVCIVPSLFINCFFLVALHKKIFNDSPQRVSHPAFFSINTVRSLTMARGSDSKSGQGTSGSNGDSKPLTTFAPPPLSAFVSIAVFISVAIYYLPTSNDVSPEIFVNRVFPDHLSVGGMLCLRGFFVLVCFVGFASAWFTPA